MRAALVGERTSAVLAKSVQISFRGGRIVTGPNLSGVTGN